MKRFKCQSGFTLVELLVTILCGAIVFAAAVTILLMGLRMNAKNTADAKRQNEVRIIFSMLQEMVAENAVTATISDDGWSLAFGSTTTMICYSEGSIKNGESVLMDGLTNSSLSHSGNLLTVEITTEDSSQYNTTIYCRLGLSFTDNRTTPIEGSRTLPATYEAETEEVTPANPRSRFLSILIGELGSSGTISGADLRYSRWYTDRQGCGDWPEDTPWCACFLSWAAAQLEDGLNSAPFFAHVNDGVWGFNGLNTSNGAEWSGQWHGAGEYTPVPGDFIFFELDGDPDTDHVGAVFSVTADTVYTIEGNVDGTVAVCSYPLDDSTIRGYGILDWAEN